MTHLAVLRATEHKGLVDAAQAGAHHKAALLFLAAHILLHWARPSSGGGAVGGGVPQLMQMDALLVEIQQQVTLILADKDGRDAALLFYGQPCQLCTTFQVVYSYLDKHQHAEVESEWALMIGTRALLYLCKVNSSMFDHTIALCHSLVLAALVLVALVLVESSHGYDQERALVAHCS